MKQINGFNVLPLKFSEKSTAYHDIFIKEHIVRNQSAELPAERTLFVLNIPNYATAESLKRIFTSAGPVSNIIFKNKNCDNFHDFTGFKAAYIVFTHPKGLLNSLKLKKLEPLSTTENRIVCGVNKWTRQYNQIKINPKEMEEQIKLYMSNYDKRKETEHKEEESVDDEGWITVKNSGRKSGLVKNKCMNQKIEEKLEKKREKKELKNFYTFQIRKSKMNQLANLRKKFEDDRKKINSLKQARKFKPF